MFSSAQTPILVLVWPCGVCLPFSPPTTRLSFPRQKSKQIHNYSSRRCLLAKVGKLRGFYLNKNNNISVRDAFTTYAVVENNVRELAAQVAAMKERGINLST